MGEAVMTIGIIASFYCLIYGLSEERAKRLLDLCHLHNLDFKA